MVGIEGMNFACGIDVAVDEQPAWSAIRFNIFGKDGVPEGDTIMCRDWPIAATAVCATLAITIAIT